MITDCPGSGPQLMIMLSLLINFQMFFLISSLKSVRRRRQIFFYCLAPNDIKMTVINEEKKQKMFNMFAENLT